MIISGQLDIVIYVNLKALLSKNARIASKNIMSKHNKIKKGIISCLSYQQNNLRNGFIFHYHYF